MIDLQSRHARCPGNRVVGLPDIWRGGAQDRQFGRRSSWRCVLLDRRSCPESCRRSRANWNWRSASSKRNRTGLLPKLRRPRDDGCRARSADRGRVNRLGDAPSPRSSSPIGKLARAGCTSSNSRFSDSRHRLVGEVVTVQLLIGEGRTFCAARRGLRSGSPFAQKWDTSRVGNADFWPPK